MSPKFQFLLSRYAGIALAKQLALGDWLGQHSWGVDIATGTATFTTDSDAQDITCTMQLLGTESTGDSTWLWAWANEASHLPPELLQACRQLQQLGFEQGIPEFSDRSFPLSVADGHQLAAIAAGISPDCCYYRGPYEGGALYFLLSGLPDHLFAPAALPRIITTLTQTLSQLEVNHLEMAQSLLKVQGFSLQQGKDHLTAERGQDRLHLVLDTQQRIQTINSTLSPV